MSEHELAPRDDSPLGRIVITESQVELIKHTVALGATDDELKLFFYECKRRGVHPLDRLIHFVKRKGKDGEPDKVAFQCSIDFMRSQAEDTGEYRGQDDLEFGPFVNIGGIEAPEWARATVKRRDPDTGEIITTSATAYWDEFYPGEKQGFMWRKLKRTMLGKCAEAQALRKGFPRKLQGLYSHEEMEQIGVINVTPRKEIVPPQKKSETTKTESRTSADNGPVISEAQAKRFYAIAKGGKNSDEEIHVFLKSVYGIESSKDIPKSKYEEICKLAEGKLAIPENSTTTGCSETPDKCADSLFGDGAPGCGKTGTDCPNV